MIAIASFNRKRFRYMPILLKQFLGYTYPTYTSCETVTADGPEKDGVYGPTIAQKICIEEVFCLNRIERINASRKDIKCIAQIKLHLRRYAYNYCQNE